MRYHNITKDDMLNGEGLRAVLWVAGCSHHCPGCHNPVTWDVNGGIPFDEAAREELFGELAKDYISGLTLSGGDPLHAENRREIGELIREVREDGEFIEAQKDNRLPWKGSANQRVIDVGRSLAQGKPVLYGEGNSK